MLRLFIAIGAFLLTVGPIAAQNDGIEIFPVDTAGGPWRMTIGTDGKPWFIAGGKIWRANQDGSATVVLDPGGGGFLSDLTIATDQRLWLATDNAVRRYDGATFTQYPVNGVYLVAAASDGSVWFATYGGFHKIGRISPAGEILELNLPTTDSGAAAMAAGTDGSMWFVNRSGRISRATVTGVSFLPEIPLSQGSDIAVASDGSLWVAGALLADQTLKVRLVHVTPAGQVIEVASFLSGSLQLVTIGPDGKVWFAGFGFFGRLNQSRADLYQVPLSINDMISVGGKVWITAQRDDGGSGGEATVSRAPQFALIRVTPALLPTPLEVPALSPIVLLALALAIGCCAILRIRV